MAASEAQRVIEVLEAEGPQLPLAVLARRLGIPPSRLVALLDDLFDEGRVTPGRERATVVLVPRSNDDGRFAHAVPGAVAQARS